MYNFIFYFIYNKALKRKGNPKIPAAMFLWLAMLGHLFFLLALLSHFKLFEMKYFSSFLNTGNQVNDEILWGILIFIPCIYFITKYYSDERINKLKRKYEGKNLYSLKNITLYYLLVFGGLIGFILLT